MDAHDLVSSSMFSGYGQPMSTFRAQAIAGRVVVIHDMPDQTVISELDAEQADVLLQQIEAAKRTVLRQFCSLECSPDLDSLVGWATSTTP